MEIPAKRDRRRAFSPTSPRLTAFPGSRSLARGLSGAASTPSLRSPNREQLYADVEVVERALQAEMARAAAAAFSAHADDGAPELIARFDAEAAEATARAADLEARLTVARQAATRARERT